MFDDSTTTPSPIRGRLSQINMIVNDMSETVAFYRLLGVDVADIAPPWEDHHRSVTNVAGDYTVEFDSQSSVANWAPEWATASVTTLIGIAVDTDDDVDRAVRLVASHGHRILQPPHDAFFGARYGVVEDPDGRPVGIMGPVRPDRHRMPPPPS